MIEVFKENLQKNKEEFTNKLGSHECCNTPAWPHDSYPPTSIFFSEAFAIYRLCQYYNIDILIESGVYRGGSTSVWGRTLSDINIFSVDKLIEGRNPREKWEGLTTTLEILYPNINFIEGDGNQVLPQIIENYPDHKIGIFVDGPKDIEGLNLAKKCLSYDNVYFSSLHDYISTDYFHTRLDEFRELIDDLDTEHPQIIKYPKGPGLTILTK